MGSGGEGGNCILGKGRKAQRPLGRTELGDGQYG